jgi:hypothetical protein
MDEARASHSPNPASIMSLRTGLTAIEDLIKTPGVHQTLPEAQILPDLSGAGRTAARSCTTALTGIEHQGSIRVTGGGPPRGPNVSTTADTPALPAPATTTSTAAGELRTRTGPSAAATGSASG